MTTAWKQCSSCKKDIAHGSTYYKCSVSTCNRQRTALFFCSVECWQAHVPGARHRDAWAEPETAPAKSASPAPAPTPAAKPASSTPVNYEPGGAGRSARRVVVSQSTAGVTDKAQPKGPKEVLVVVSKLKSYIKDRSGMSTSDGVVPVLSDHLRAIANEAIRNAARDGRRTVLDRDFLPLVEE